jgi:hemerythrin superfamily protein
MIPTISTAREQGDAETGEVDAIALLIADHEDVNELFIEYHDVIRGEGMDEERADLVEQICQALTAHATLEEELFYPAARDALDDPGLIEMAEHEHAEAKVLIEQLQGMSALDDQYDNTVQQLQHAIEQHVQEEEEELFPLVRESNLDVFALGMQMVERRDELASQAQDEFAED